MLYKYRSIENIEFFIDIILNERMYAANYKDLNDPMEGLYRYSAFGCNEEIIKKISDRKSESRIVSMSRSFKNSLMWSHYADGHKGVAIGVEVENSVPINYIPQSYLLENTDSISTDNIARQILSNKHELWSYEEEERIFSNQEFVDVTVKKIIFGKKVKDDKKIFLTKLVERLNPEIEIVDIRDIEFEEGSFLSY